MGGPGSGHSWRYGSKDTVEDHRSIDVRRWKREGWLTSGQSRTIRWSRGGETTATISVRIESWRVVLSYRIRQHGGDWESVEEPISLTTTPGIFGGYRTWFQCPAVGCGRRVALLYGAGKYFACRHCYNLAYPSSREDADGRATRRADRIRERLRWEPGILNGDGDKPKWMRWRTFERLAARHEELVDMSLVGAMMKLGIGADILA
jgi:hypothetical protein